MSVTPKLQFIEGFTSETKNDVQYCGEGNESVLPPQKVKICGINKDIKSLMIVVELVEQENKDGEALAHLETRYKTMTEQDIEKGNIEIIFDSLLIEDDIETSGKKYLLRFVLADPLKINEENEEEGVLDEIWSTPFELLNIQNCEQKMKELSVGSSQHNEKNDHSPDNADQSTKKEEEELKKDEESKNKEDTKSHIEEEIEEGEEEEEDSQTRTLTMLENINETVQQLADRFEVFEKVINTRLENLEKKVDEMHLYETPKLLAYQLCYETKMNFRYAEKCLQDNGWQYAKALDAFKTLKDKLPPDAFIREEIDQKM